MPRNNHPRPARRHHAESGNAFFIVMIGVILFAALMFTFSRGARQGGENMSEQQARIFAQEIMTLGQKHARAAQRVLLKGCSENDVSFDADGWGHTYYRHTPVVADKCKIYNTEGGGITWRDSAPEWRNGDAPGYNIWINGETAVTDIGTSAPELIFWVLDIKPAICVELNKNLGLPETISETVSSHTGGYNGTFGDPPLPDGIGDDGGSVLTGVRAGAFSNGTAACGYYHVLMDR